MNSAERTERMPDSQTIARRELVLAVLGLAVYSLLLYGRLLFAGRVLAEGDLLLYFMPYRDYAAELLRSGQLPFWNPYLFAGAPFLANPQAAVLYPLHWPLAWLRADLQIYWSAALHVWLLGVGGYLLTRRLGGGGIAALTAAVVLQGSGFIGGLLGHLNQLNGVAWLPWMLLLLTPMGAGRTRRQLALDAAWLALVVALMLLAGHTQTSYINLAGAGLWLVVIMFCRWRSAVLVPGWRGNLSRLLRTALPLLMVYGVGCVLGALLAMPQLLPTLELSSRGLRSGGLSWLEVTSFSLSPLTLPWSLLPTYGLVNLAARFATPAWSEFLAWVGVVAMALAAAALFARRWRKPAGLPGVQEPFLLHGIRSGMLLAGGVWFAAAGLFLALGRWNPAYWLLYQIVPGFDLFRTPARWMALYTLGMALLAAAGVQALQQRGTRARSWSALLPALVAVELLAASLGLPSAHPTAQMAVDAVRTAPAHLLSAPDRMAAMEQGLDPAAAGRFLGMSTITYDPGDMADLHRIYREPGAGVPAPLSQEAFDALIVALKVQELMVPNLPLAQRVPSIDGYDGGVIPVQRYTQLVSLLAPSARLVADGRLREQIGEVPSTALLGLLDVRHLVTDKVRDLWFDDVFYDRQIGAWLLAGHGPLTVEATPQFEATHIDLIGYVEPATATALAVEALEGVSRTVGSVIVEGDSGRQPFVLTAGGAPGAHLADGALDSAPAAASGAVVALRDVDAGRQEYRVRLPLGDPVAPHRLLLEALDPQLVLVIRAVTLLDARTGMFQALLPSDRGRFRLVHSGDVKIYENLDVGGRVSLHTDVRVAGSATEALEILRTLDLETQVVVEGTLPPAFDVQPSRSTDGSATLVAYTPEEVVVQTTSDRPALLLLRDAWDTGWSATIDGAPTEVLPANVDFRGVVVPAGAHEVRFSYQPPYWRLGLLLAAVGALVWLALLLWAQVVRSDSLTSTRQHPSA